MKGGRSRSGRVGGLTVTSFLAEQDRKEAQRSGSAGSGWKVKGEQPGPTESGDNGQRSALTDDKLHAVVEVARSVDFRGCATVHELDRRLQMLLAGRDRHPVVLRRIKEEYLVLRYMANEYLLCSPDRREQLLNTWREFLDDNNLALTKAANVFAAREAAGGDIEPIVQALCSPRFKGCTTPREVEARYRSLMNGSGQHPYYLEPIHREYLSLNGMIRDFLKSSISDRRALLKMWSGKDVTGTRAREDTAGAPKCKNTEESRDNISLDAMTPDEFEVYVRAYFERKGYVATLTPPSNDRGVDVWLEKEGVKGAVQCKHKSSGYKVGSPDVQALIGAAVTEGADFAYIVTNQDFTENALEAIKRCSKVKVIAIGRAQLRGEADK